MNVARRRVGLQIGDQVRMSAERRQRIDAAAFYRADDGGLIARDWCGTIEDFDDRGRAVVTHAAENCGCSFERGQWCRRCENTGTATRRFINTRDLETL